MGGSALVGRWLHERVQDRRLQAEHQFQHVDGDVELQLCHLQRHVARARCAGHRDRDIARLQHTTSYALPLHLYRQAQPVSRSHLCVQQVDPISLHAQAIHAGFDELLTPPRSMTNTLTKHEC